MSSKEYHAAYNLERYYRRKERYVTLLGGCCVKCGGKDNLQFDHKDSKDKTFTISAFMTYPVNVVLEELKKCQLLCVECHKEKTTEEKDGFDKRARGERVSTAKLTTDDVRVIKERLKTETIASVAKDFEVSRRAVQFIKNGVTWKHIQDA